MSTRTINQKTHWVWDEGTEHTSSSCSMFSLHSHGDQHVSLEVQPPARRYYIIPEEFRRVQHKLRGMAKKGYVKKIWLDLLSERQVYPKRDWRRTWTIQFIAEHRQNFESTFKYVGKVPDMSALKNIFRVLNTCRELVSLEKLSEPLVVHADNLGFFEEDQRRYILEKCSKNVQKRPVVLSGDVCNMLFQDMEKGIILKQSNKLFSYQGLLHEQITLLGRSVFSRSDTSCVEGVAND